MQCGGSPICEMFGAHHADGGCGGGLVGIGIVFGVSLQRGLSVWVWGLSRPSLLGGVPQPKFVGDGSWGMGAFGNLDYSLAV